MTKNIAYYLSMLLHPLLLPIYAMVYVLYGSSMWSLLPPDFKISNIMYIGLGTCIIPLLLMLLLLRLHIISSPSMETRNERLVPLFLVCVSIGLSCHFVHARDMVFPMVRMCDGMLIMVLSALAVTPFWKISLHAMGVGALIVFVTVIGLTSGIDFSVALCITFAIAGIVGWARMYLDSHTPMQMFSGLCVGMVSMTIAMLYS